jgi:FtsZ-binding cell division protein ZapB
MDTPEQQPKEPSKRTRVRLASPRKQFERTIQQMAKLSETPMKPEKLVDLLTTLSAHQVKLLDIDRDTKQDALIEENKQLKGKLAAANNQSDDAIQRIRDQVDSLRLTNFTEVEALKSQNATLQAENTELAKTNDALKSEKSKLTQKMQSLERENAELQLTIKKLELREPKELLEEVDTKLKVMKLNAVT